MKPLEKLCAHLHYVFQDEKKLLLALSHRSASKLNNERLEFLGDSLLNFIIGELLFEQQPNATEGELSRLRAFLVKGDTLAAIAKEFSLGDYLILGPGELKSGGYKRASILAGALEAIVGAIYLDGGIEACINTVHHWYTKRIEELSSAQECKDPKTLLQEYLQSKHYRIPIYSLLDAKGQAHQQLFTVECHITELEITACASGSSRRQAEQAVAQKILQVIHDKK